jgi:uncharacterized protein YndB with AHSA1/START domain
MHELNRPAALVGDREIVATRVFDAPRETVFRMWTDPQHVGQWWGPRGFTTTTFAMDVRPGGVWRFVMHGPDGRDYENKITYTEVVEPQRIAYKHGGDRDTEPVNFTVTVTFDDLGGRTKLTMRMLFPSASARDAVVKNYGAVHGLDQTLGRLGERVASDPADLPFVIARTFDAPRDRVFEVWSKREHLMRWFGPKGFTMPDARLDFRPGGLFHYRMVSPDGHEMWGKFVFREILPPQRIVFVNSFSDANAGLARHPGSEMWPMEMLSTVTFAEHQGRTTVTVSWVPLNPTPAERATFDAGRESMRTGWGGTFERLAAYLAKN